MEALRVRYTFDPYISGWKKPLECGRGSVASFVGGPRHLGTLSPVVCLSSFPAPHLPFNLSESVYGWQPPKVLIHIPPITPGG